MTLDKSGRREHVITTKGTAEGKQLPLFRSVPYHQTASETPKKRTAVPGPSAPLGLQLPLFNF